jgi:hypothetical protein
MCESFHSHKAKPAPKDFDWQGPWKARVAEAIFDINRAGWRIEFYDRFPEFDSQTQSPFHFCRAFQAKFLLSICALF